MPNGTHKTLEQAILNGILDLRSSEKNEISTPLIAAKTIHPHVKDFLAHKLAAFILIDQDPENKQLRALWKQITGEDIK